MSKTFLFCGRLFYATSRACQRLPALGAWLTEQIGSIPLLPDDAPFVKCVNSGDHLQILLDWANGDYEPMTPIRHVHEWIKRGPCYNLCAKFTRDELTEISSVMCSAKGVNMDLVFFVINDYENGAFNFTLIPGIVLFLSIMMGMALSYTIGLLWTTSIPPPAPIPWPTTSNPLTAGTGVTLGVDPDGDTCIIPSGSTDTWCKEVENKPMYRANTPPVVESNPGLERNLVCYINNLLLSSIGFLAHIFRAVAMACVRLADRVNDILLTLWIET